jgi:AraC-like DNA-binding protein
MRRISTTLASKAQALVRYGLETGIERSRMLASARLAPEALARGDGRVASESVATLWSDLTRWTSDTQLGLRLAESESTSSAFGVVGFRAMTSGTLGDAMACFVEYGRVVNDDASTRVRHESHETTFEQDFAPGPATAAMTDRALASCVLLARRWTGEPLRPRQLKLRRERPRDTSGYDRVFGCPVVFGERSDAVVFDRAATSLPLHTAQAEVAGYLDALAKAARADLPRHDAGGAVSQVVRETLDRGDPGLPAVARRLGVGVRTLQRRLLAEGLTYHGVVDRVRHEVAVDLVSRTETPLATVGERVGYAEAKAFRRAFRRWTGLSPAELRRGDGST